MTFRRRVLRRIWEQSTSAVQLSSKQGFTYDHLLIRGIHSSSTQQQRSWVRRHLHRDEFLKSHHAQTNALARNLTFEAEKRVAGEDTLENEMTDFPGARTSFMHEMRFISEVGDEPVPCYRVLDELGKPLPNCEFPKVDEELAKRMYSHMVTLQVMDGTFYEAQRQGRFSFYVTTIGEEAINIATAAALSLADVVFSQYREPGPLIWRGFTIQDIANQCFGNGYDLGKGRQMPVHYGSKELNFTTVSSPIATQIPQAVGAAYSMKMENKDACSVCYFGDGATSEGDFHAAMNFAAVLDVPTLFICRNNGWAISTPTSDQFKSDGVVVKARGYGIRSIRVDGNDALALYATVMAARKMVIEESKPVLIEALTYRIGHHSTSDDSSKYRPRDEIEHWKMVRDPVLRFKRWLEYQGWWTEEDENTLRSRLRKEVIAALKKADDTKKPSVSDLFTDVYESVTPNLMEQESKLRATVSRHPSDYPADVPLW